MEWFDETLYDGIRQSLTMDRVLHRTQTDHQDLVIFENSLFGRVLALDGVVQTTESDEYVYHEMLAHPAIFARKAALDAAAVRIDVLIIGGGDGGCLREVLHHPEARATMVEIDPGVIDLSKTYLPNHAAGAFDDPRTTLVIADGARFVEETDQRFDIVIIDSTDPIGPGAVLFTREFYAGCKRCLKDGGVMITQNGVPALQGAEVTTSYRHFQTLFRDAAFYVAAVPTYQGGFMALGWATDDTGLRQCPPSTIQAGIDTLGLTTRYFNADIFAGAFALPNFMRDLMAD